MKIFLKIGYFLLFLILITILYLEYNNYKRLNYKVETIKYETKIETLKANINIIKNYSNINNQKLTNAISRCINNIRYLDILNKQFITIEDINYIKLYTASGTCNSMEYSDDINIDKIYEKYKYEIVDLYQYIKIYNNQTIEKSFETILDNEIKTTSAFIEMVEYLMEDSDV